MEGRTARTSVEDMVDRTTKLLVLAIAVGLWLNVATNWLSPTPVLRDMSYDLGRDVPRDYAQAAAWFRNAADQGNAAAQATLADAQKLAREWLAPFERRAK